MRQATLPATPAIISRAFYLSKEQIYNIVLYGLSLYWVYAINAWKPRALLPRHRKVRIATWQHAISATESFHRLILKSANICHWYLIAPKHRSLWATREFAHLIFQKGQALLFLYIDFNERHYSLYELILLRACTASNGQSTPHRHKCHFSYILIIYKKWLYYIWHLTLRPPPPKAFALLLSRCRVRNILAMHEKKISRLM